MSSSGDSEALASSTCTWARLACSMAAWLCSLAQGRLGQGKSTPGCPAQLPCPLPCPGWGTSLTSSPGSVNPGCWQADPAVGTQPGQQSKGTVSFQQVPTTTPSGRREAPKDPLIPGHPPSGRDLPAGGPQSSGAHPLLAAYPSVGSGHRPHCLWGTPFPPLCPAGSPQSSCLPAAALFRLQGAARGWPHPPGTSQLPLAAQGHARNCLVPPGILGSPGWPHPAGWHGAERGQEAAAPGSPVSWCQETSWGAGELWGQHRGHHRSPWGSGRAMGTMRG